MSQKVADWLIAQHLTTFAIAVVYKFYKTILITEDITPVNATFEGQHRKTG